MMAAEVSCERGSYVWAAMDYAEGLHYVNLWYAKRRVDLVSEFATGGGDVL